LRTNPGRSRRAVSDDPAAIAGPARPCGLTDPTPDRLLGRPRFQPFPAGRLHSELGIPCASRQCRSMALREIPTLSPELLEPSPRWLEISTNHPQKVTRSSPGSFAGHPVIRALDPATGPRDAVTRLRLSGPRRTDDANGPGSTPTGSIPRRPTRPEQGGSPHGAGPHGAGYEPQRATSSLREAR
jgi:hypothetical protein